MPSLQGESILNQELQIGLIFFACIFGKECMMEKLQIEMKYKPLIGVVAVKEPIMIYLKLFH